MKNAELEAKHQKYKSRVVLRRDIVKDFSGSYAVFTEQGSSASQMTAAKVMDIISRLPCCGGQAAGAVSAHTQVQKLSVYVDDIKLAGKKLNIIPMWKLLKIDVDLGETTSFVDHVYLGCTQRQCEISKDIVDNCRAMFESRMSSVRTEKLPFSENFRISSWSYDMEGHTKKSVERYCE